jgi:xanthine dehydrogenase accessory factor
MQSIDLDVLHHLHDWLVEQRRAWLVTVTRTFGASPRPPGSMLAMRDDGLIVGSVSGGCIEDDLIARRDTFMGAVPRIEQYGVTSDEARRFGLPCGGELEVVIESSLSAADVATLLSKIHARQFFMRSVDLKSGAWQFSEATRDAVTTIDGIRFHCLHGPRWRMLIIGASEIAVYLAEIAKTLDFAVTVVEPRREYVESWRVSETNFADGMPDEAVLAFKPDGNSVVIAVSHDPKLDDMALMEALKTPAFYVGAVGSQKTSSERRSRLQTLDVSATEVALLKGPVGLPIGSRTPPEIAIAIAAELVAARNRIKLVRQ